jgi:hypothetical protein
VNNLARWAKPGTISKSVNTGGIMPGFIPGSGESIQTGEVAQGFDRLVGILEAHHKGLGVNDAMAEMVGDSPSYNALMAGADHFLTRYPDFLRGSDRGPAPEVMGLWMGLIIGASLRNKAGEDGASVFTVPPEAH